MTYEIRPVRPEDYEALAVCNRAAMPGTDDSGESLKEEDAHTHAMERWVVEVGGEVVGNASWFQLPSRLHPQKFWMDGSVHPDYQHRGLGEALLKQVLSAVLPKEPISLRTATREDYTGSVRFLVKHGFAEAKRTWVSELDLAGFAFAPYEGQPERVEAEGIRLVRLATLHGEPGWQERLRVLYNAIQSDVPDFDAAATVPMESFQERYLGSNRFQADGHFIALDGDRWIGLCSLWKGSEAAHMDIGLTGVLPQFRRRGIALALKLRSMAWARERGVAKLKTNNASTNLGMLAINDRLGFVRQPAWIHFVRSF